MAAPVSEEHRAQMVKEHLELQKEFMDYVGKNGFDSAAFYSPQPGSFFERYRKRWEEISLAITAYAAK